MSFQIALLAALFAIVNANVYIHNPRGSNNRYDAANDNAQNPSRMFMSWNNPRGGYNAGTPMYYYVDSELELEFAVTQSCGAGAEEKAHCNIVVQYMCSEWLRDGMSEQTITANNRNTMTEGKYVYGMHESYDYYQDCSARERNTQLFTADRTLTGNTAMYTRQNPSGNRYGFECPEERDYYPYWHPTPWRDIVIYTNHVDELIQGTPACEYYQTNSQNVMDKGYCSNDPKVNSESGCTSWVEGGRFGLNQPDCLAAPFQRSNSMSNTIGGEFIRYKWKVPRVPAEEMCAIRVRYNITSGEYDRWNTFSDKNEDTITQQTRFRPAGLKSPVVWNPFITYGSKNLSYAVNTRMMGAVYEDRTHAFQVRERPNGITNPIFNLNVRGKRGNIVETFPATEYDFVPNKMRIPVNSWVHVQWTGTDENPDNAAGEGLDQTDRNNIVQLDKLMDNYPIQFGEQNLFSMAAATDIGFAGMTMYADKCKTMLEIQQSNNNADDEQEDVANCMKLNQGTPYFDGGLQPMPRPGTYHYMSSRNNNFSNRSQKGTIIVEDCGAGSATCPVLQVEELPESGNANFLAIPLALFALLFLLF